MDRKDTSPSNVTGAGAAAPMAALAPLFECDADLDALERVVLALAVHPQGGGAARAWLLQWNPRRGMLEGWRVAAAVAAREALDQALGRARRAAPADSPDERRLRAWAEAPARLEGALSAAWRGATNALGAGGDQPGAPWSDASRVAAARLRRGARLYGAIVLEPAAGMSDETAGERLEGLRALAEAAFAGQVRADEAKSRARQAVAVAEFARACVSSINVAEALHLLARLSAQGAGVRGAAVFLAAADGGLRLEVAHGVASVRDRMGQAFLAVARETMAGGRTRAGERAEEAPQLPADVAGETTAWAAVPIVAYERRLGALVAYDGNDRPATAAGLEAHDLSYLETLAAQAGLVLEHARSLTDAKRSGQTEREAGSRLRELDRLKGVSELAARVAQEARNPLASIAAFAKRAHRALSEGDAQGEYLEIVVRETARLEAMLQEQLEYAKLERPRLRVQGLNAVVQEALQRSSETLVRRRVRLLKKLAPDLPQLLLDAPRIKRVVENIVAYALECVSMGGRIQVESRRAGGFVLVEIAFDGQRQGGDLLEQLFVPFATSPAGGAAVGLGMAQQIVREHGGEVRVRGESDWSTIFSFTLPVAGNEDRRRSRERRSVRGDRRRRDADSGGGGV
jgi:signal transduction histidine kinase